MSTPILVISVLASLFVYWAAEEYAAVLGELAAGVRFGWSRIGRHLVATWSMVSASYAPLVAVVLATWAGASSRTSANFGLAVAAGLLAIYGFIASRAAQLRSWKLAGSTAIAVMLGLGMILLKNYVLH